jgi:peptidoglycan/LPS O-acetylase OafA/YrhL
LRFHIGQETGNRIVPDGYLAVDFFFVLSGFVITLAYEKKLNAGLSLRVFGQMRLKRLYPTLLVGMAIGVAPLMLGLNPYADPGAWIVLQLFLIPMTSGALLYPLNGPMWSIFYELFANLVHFAAVRKMNNTAVLLATVMCGLALFAVAILRPAKGVEWGFGPGIGFVIGFARVGFSYLLGTLICRLHQSGRLRPGSFNPLIAPIALVLVLGSPSFGSASIKSIVALTVVFPAIIVVGLNARLHHPWLARYLGRLSFPLYAIHAPLIYLAHGWVPPTVGAWCVAALVIIALASAVDYFVDTPHQLRLREAYHRVSRTT